MTQFVAMNEMPMASLLHIATPGAGTDGRVVIVNVDSSLAMATHGSIHHMG